MDAPPRPNKRTPPRPDRDRRGAGAVEYCLVAALICTLIISALSALSVSIQTQLDAVSAAIAGPTP